jgi:Protein of unknown function (DUF2829)
MDFSKALEAIKRGKKVKRAHWGGYWFMPASEPYIESEEAPMKPMIVASLKDNGGYVPATTYQEDLLADDWLIVSVDQSQEELGSHDVYQLIDLLRTIDHHPQDRALREKIKQKLESILAL